MNNLLELPTSAVHHWDTQAGYEMAVKYQGLEKSVLCMGDKTDGEVAEGLRLARLSDFDLIGWQTAAKERLRWLSVQLAVKLTEYKIGSSLNLTILEKQFIEERKELPLFETSDFQLANAQFMADRKDEEFKELREATCERIIWLSKKLGCGLDDKVIASEYVEDFVKESQVILGDNRTDLLMNSEAFAHLNRPVAIKELFYIGDTFDDLCFNRTRQRPFFNTQRKIAVKKVSPEKLAKRAKQKAQRLARKITMSKA
jgi:hypothetical protein